MRKVLIFGNSGSGKSTLALDLKNSSGLEHLDLDELAWINSNPPQRAPLAESRNIIDGFMKEYDSWVVEGCYADLLEFVTPEANELIYLNIPIEQCVENARNRDWEPHKYPSKQAQDENLEMLISWIKEYELRDDVFSQSAHLDLFNSFSGEKKMYTDNARDT